MMDLSIRLLDQVFMELVYLMILLMTCDALAEIRSLKYLNMYLFFASIIGIMGKGMRKNSYLYTNMGKLVVRVIAIFTQAH